MPSQEVEAPPLLLKQDGARLFVTFNRPQRRNALNDAMLLELETFITRLEDDRSVRVVVFRGAGGHFCAGSDIRERRAQTSDSRPGEDIAMARNLRAGRMFLRLANLPQTTVAAIEGYALGGGFGFACTFDIALVMHDVQIGMSETRIGVAAAQIAPHVVRRGLVNARYFGFTGRRLNGEEAVHMGVAHEIAQSTAEQERACSTISAPAARWPARRPRL